MENPDILMLDEPMNGLDGDGTAKIHAIIEQYKRENKLIILASHMIDDVMQTCDEVYQIQNKRLVRIQK